MSSVVRRRAYRRPAMKRAMRRLGKSRVSVANMHYKYEQTVGVGSIASSTTLPTENNFAFTLSQLPQASTFSALYDAYRITKVELKFYPRSNVNAGNAGTNYTTTFHTAIDYDDVSNLGSLNSLLQYQTLKSFQSTKYCTRTVVPRVADSVYISGVSTGYAENKSNQWLDCASDTVPHYGIRTWLGDVGGLAGAVTFDVFAKFHIEFKAVR